MRKNITHKNLRGIDFIKTLKNHFFKYIIIPENDNDCMKWNGYINPSGYGKLCHNWKSYRASRLSYQIFIGKIPENMEVCHKCDNTTCVNPNHLFIGTHTDNMRDMSKKGRQNILRGEQKKLSKLKEKDIVEIRIKLKEGLTQKEIGKIYGVDATIIGDIKLNKIWRHVK